MGVMLKNLRNHSVRNKEAWPKESRPEMKKVSCRAAGCHQVKITVRAGRPHLNAFIIPGETVEVPISPPFCSVLALIFDVRLEKGGSVL